MEHHFNVIIATKYGVDAAVLIHNLHFWITKNKANNKHFHNGRYWTYNSISAFENLFPYWTKRQLERILNGLVEKGVLYKDNFNENKYDRTTWYALHEIVNSIYLKGENDSTKLGNGNHESVKPIPYTNTYSNHSDNNTNNKTGGFGFSHEPEDGENRKEKNCAKKEKEFIPKNAIEKNALEVLNFLNENRRKWLNSKRDFEPTSKTHFSFITARLQKYSVDELKGVIAIKFMQWANNPNMKQYLTPDTLFNETKCAKYIQELDLAKQNPNYANEQRTSQTARQQPNDPNTIQSIFNEIDNSFNGAK